ncbi:sensor domain-containing diguanylate cyclase [Ectothiorhodospiraceae bacterium BW-2]|nr:sensor domain-containing diguanylate cyclase [Ectothiorhodospiraceae bacterium BW-2]
MSSDDSIVDLHWLLGVIQHVDVGLIVLDRHYRVKLWNAFMENHSGKSPNEVNGRELFELIPETPREWLKNKLDSVFILKNSSFSTWQQRPYIVQLRSYRPLTGASEWMYQNVTFLPLSGMSSDIEQICLIIYDVTDMAMNTMQLQQQSRTDHLTRLLSIHAWEQQVGAELGRTLRTGTTSTLALVTVDDFDKINQQYGYQAGDEVLKIVAQLITTCMRGSDVAGRYGERRFGVILTDTDEEGGVIFLHRLQQAASEEQITYSHHAITLTLSAGVAERPTLGSERELWLERVDIALNEALEQGRGSVMSYKQMFLI